MSQDAGKDIKPLSPETRRRLLADLLRRQAEMPRVFPLSQGQKALWFLNRLAPESAGYNITFAARLGRPVDAEALHGAFSDLLSRHPILGVTFTVRDGEPVHCFPDRPAEWWSRTDVTGTSDELRLHLTREGRRPFDLETGPVFRASLFERRAEDPVLLLVFHHLVADYWTLILLLSDLGRLYSARLGGAPADLAPLALDYSDYVNWQRAMLGGPEGERLWSYWRAELAGAPAHCDLPAGGPRPPIQTYRGAYHRFRLDPELTRQLGELARTEGATLYQVFLAAFQTLLHRYTGETDILVGSSVAGRDHPGFAAIVGYFVNQIVLRADLSTDPSFRLFLADVHRTALAAMENQDFPFSLLVERMGLPRDPSRSPLFQAELTWQRSQLAEHAGASLFLMGHPGARLDLGDLKMESVALDHCAAPFDLSLIMEEAGGALYGIFNYNTDVLEARTVQALAGHFETLLAGLAASPDARLSRLPLLTGAERARVLVDWSAARVNGQFREKAGTGPEKATGAAPAGPDRPQDQRLDSLYQAQVSRTPEAPAAVCGDEALSYGELNRRASQLAHYLRRRGVGPETIVGIYLGRSLKIAVSVLGILKAGGAFLPLDPTYPTDRLGFILNDSKVSLIVTDRERLPALTRALTPWGADGPGPATICLDGEADEWGISEQLDSDPAAGALSGNLAYVIYTSGSTGRPKGVMLEHAGIREMAEAQIAFFGAGGGDRILQFAPLCFDASVFEMTMAWRAGAALYLAPPEDIQPGPDLAATLRKRAITHLTVPPSVLEVLPRVELPALRVLVVAGEACPAAAVEAWAPGRRFFNAYGPTETTVWATVAECRPGEAKPPIGGPVARKRVYVLDRNLEPVPPGVVGELYVGGGGQARGYLGRPDLTAASFLPDPFSAGAGGERLYRTGDLVRFRPDGALEYAGRVDYQVKFAGVRIELEEIDAALADHPKVRRAVTVLREDGPQGKRLVTYVVWAGPESFAAVELRGYLRERLPPAMVPGVFVSLDSLPLTASGKVDRRALPAPEAGRLDSGRGYVAPRTELESRVAAVFAELTGLERVGVFDNVFDLGIHSLALVRVQEKLRGLASREMPLAEMFRHTTVASIARYLERGTPETASHEADQARGAARRAATRGGDRGPGPGPAPSRTEERA